MLAHPHYRCSQPDEFENDSGCDWDLNQLITTPREALEVELSKGGERELIAAALEGVLEMATAEDAVSYCGLLLHPSFRKA